MQTIQASTDEDMAAARLLFQEYVVWLGVDLSFQGFEAELAGLPGQYAPPQGRLLLTRGDDGIMGCVALRPLGDMECEMKRLYVRPAFRGRGMGNMLARQIIAEARAAGYAIMKLDTLPLMTPAIRLYESLGFVRCEAYYSSPLKDTVFMELRLQ